MARRTKTERRIYVGTSGYVYPDWRGVFYPPGLLHKEELAYYASRFRTVELNNTFYRLPSQAAVRGWAERVPPGFVFSVKGSRYLTHLKRFKETGQGIARFFEAIAALGGHLGPVLWQLPPQMKKDPARLAAFLEALPAGHDYAVELRNPDWYCEEVFDLLDRHSASLCLHDMIDAPAPLPPPGPIYYRRFHGLHGSYGGRYGRRALMRPAAEIATLAAAGRPCFAYFNNDRNADAVFDAATLEALLAEALAEQGIGYRP
ncbi:MAG: DUF72 domain-containing protein [Myxococcales bacterium]|jgi:uncharacterized protein YecE (DUF72 family)